MRGYFTWTEDEKEKKWTVKGNWGENKLCLFLLVESAVKEQPELPPC